MRLTARHWVPALAIALLVHAGAVIALLPQLREPMAGDAGGKRVVVSLGPAGRAPGAVAAARNGAATGVEAAAFPEAVQPTRETAGASPAPVSAAIPPASSEPRVAEPRAKPFPTTVDAIGQVETANLVPGPVDSTRADLIHTKTTNPKNLARPRTRPAPLLTRPASPLTGPALPLTDPAPSLADPTLPLAGPALPLTRRTPTLATPSPVIPKSLFVVAAEAGIQGRRSGATAEPSPPRPVWFPASAATTDPVPAETVHADGAEGAAAAKSVAQASETRAATAADAPELGPVSLARAKTVEGTPTNDPRAPLTPGPAIARTPTRAGLRATTLSNTAPRSAATVHGQVARVGAALSGAGPGGGSRGSGTLSPGDKADYLARVRGWLERHKRYPRRARLLRQEGTAILYLVMDRDGRLREYKVRRSTGHELLDQAVVTMIERAQPLPRMPDSMTRSALELVVPVEFVLR